MSDGCVDELVDSTHLLALPWQSSKPKFPIGVESHESLYFYNPLSCAQIDESNRSAGGAGRSPLAGYFYNPLSCAQIDESNCSAGGAGGRSPLAGARGVLASFPSSSPAAAGGTGEIPEKLLS